MSQHELVPLALTWVERAVRPMRSAVLLVKAPGEVELLGSRGFGPEGPVADPTFNSELVREVMATDRAMVLCDDRGPQMRSNLCVPVRLARGRYLLYADHRATWRPYYSRDLTRLRQVARQLEAKFGAAPASRPLSLRLGVGARTRPRVATRELVVLLRSLQTLYGAGLMLDRALLVLSRSLPPGPLAEACDQMLLDVRQGNPLSLAMSKQPQLFSPSDSALVQVGEQSGSLDRVLGLLADAAERQRALQQRWFSVAIYPALLAGVCLLLLLGLLPLLLRGQARMLIESGQALSPVTRVAFALVGLLQSPWLWLLLGALGLSLTRVPAVSWRRLVARLPLLGAMVRESALSQFCWGLATALETGYNCRQALTLSAGTLRDPELEGAARQAAERLQGGHTVAESLKLTGHFPRLLLETVAVGEECGRLPESLQNAGRMLEQTFETRCSLLAQLLEPAVLLVMGGVCGFFALATLLPMLSLLESL